MATTAKRSDLRNVAIVDHGKTTLRSAASAVAARRTVSVRRRDPGKPLSLRASFLTAAGATGVGDAALSLAAGERPLVSRGLVGLARDKRNLLCDSSQSLRVSLDDLEIVAL